MTTTASKVSVATLAVAVAFLAFAGIASADYRGDRGNDGDSTSVRTENNATVNNSVKIEAETGDNEANGDDGAYGGRGGNAHGDDATGGAGGNGGRGGDGGTVTSGDAAAYGTLFNDVNYNLAEIDSCGCEDDNDGWGWFSKMKRGGDDGDRIRVSNTNNATVNNDFEVEAETGDNEANGDDGAYGGRGGNAHDGEKMQKRSFSMWFKWWGGDDSAATGGDGGNGGAGGHGGTVRSGAAYAEGHVENYVNYNITRINGGEVEDED